MESRQDWNVCDVAETRSSPHPSALFQPCLRPSERVPARFVTSKPPPGAPGGGFDGTERAETLSDGRKQDRNSADGCGEDRAWDSSGGGVGGNVAVLPTQPAVSRAIWTVLNSLHRPNIDSRKHF